MTMPIIIYQPKVFLRELDASGVPVVGTSIDVSCDFAIIELGVSQTLITATTFCGKFQVPDDIEETATAEITFNADTHDRWDPLVGNRYEVRVKDRDTDTDYRAFDTEVRINPALYGPTRPGATRTITFDLPVLSSPTLVTGTP